MHTSTVNIGAPGEGVMYIATIEEGAGEHSAGAVSHVVGGDLVTIRSSVKSWGSILIFGKANLALLRDAFIEICEMEGIE